jgi:ABC-type uncharacterized transport system involved in gliding motility auxiliary subunit
VTVRTLRNLTGVVALLLFVVGVNALLLQETLTAPVVAGPLIGAVVLGVVWFGLWIATTARRDRGTGGGPLNAVVASVFVLGICGMAYAFVARAGGSWDLTQEGRTELAPQTVQVLESLTETVEVVCFFVKAGDDRARIAQDKTRRFLERCQEHTEQLQVLFVDPQAEPQQVKKYQAIGVQRSQVGSVVIASGARQREIPLSDVSARLEERDFTNALINVARETKPKVYFLMGHGGWDVESEDPQTGAQTFAALLASQSYDLLQMTLGPDSAAVPADCDVLVINGFTDDLREYEVEAIDAYLAGGGRLLLLINPLVAANNPGVTTVERLRPWLEQRLGVRLPTDVLVSKETGGVQIAFLPDFSIFEEFVDPMDGIARFRGSYNADHPITAPLDKSIALSLVRTVEPVEQPPAGVSHTILLRSTPGCWAETDLDAIMNQRQISMNPGEAQGPNAAAMSVTVQAEVNTSDGSRPREGRAVVIGNAYLTTNEYMMFGGAQDLVLNTMAWLTASEERIGIRASVGAEEPIILTLAQQRTIAWVASLGSVQAIALVGAAVLLWRRRYR